MQDMSRRPSKTKKPDPFTPPPRPLPQICAEAGFTGIEQRSERATFAIRDPPHYWDWSMSHGFRGYVDSLGPELAGEFRARMFAGLERLTEAVAGAGAFAVGCDLGRLDEIERAVRQVTAVAGRLDVLVNCGSATKTGPALSSTDEDWASAFEVKVFGALRMMRAARSPATSPRRGT